jgi:hypothetical protein
MAGAPAQVAPFAALHHRVYVRFFWLAAALLAICSCALMRGPLEQPRCLDLEATCHASPDCCSNFCANGECVENPYSGGATLVPRRNVTPGHLE